MLVLGVIAAADVAAGETEPEVNPRVAEREAFLAALRARRDVVDLFEVAAALGASGEPLQHEPGFGG